MSLIADRFLADDDEVVDLATGETVRLSIDAGTATRSRVELCDRLFAVRHPLLLPLIDYGVCADGWFEAHADLPALRASGMDARGCALHLVRFLRACGIDLDAAAAARNVRPKIDLPSAPPQRPIGVRLHARPSLDAIRTVLESTGPPGVSAIAVCGAAGAGLHTARLQLARAARLAGYLVIDSRFGVLDAVANPARHFCVLDWLPPSAALPPLLALTASAGARRHVWIRFCRQPARGARVIGLEPLMTRDLTTAIYLDPEYGPTAAEVRNAIDAAGGLPGIAVAALTSGRSARAGSWRVHETAPEYTVHSRVVPAVARIPTAGVARLERAVDAAHALARRGRHARAARVFARCSTALAARGAPGPAAAAACALGELHLDRGRPRAAFEAFQQAQAWTSEGATGARALIGSGRALLEQGCVTDAEAVFRTARLAEPSPHALSRRWLAETLILRGRLEAAEEALGDADQAVLSTIARLHGDLAGAGRAAARALASATDNPSAECAAHVAMAHVQAAMGVSEAVRQHGAAAYAAARRLRSPSTRLIVAAEVLACLEQCGVKDRDGRDRLIRAAKRLPPLPAARIRTAIGAPLAADRRLIATTETGSTDLIHRFRSLVAAIHEAPDECAALHAIAQDLHVSLESCSVVLRSAVLNRAVATAGRTWIGEEAASRVVLDGAGTIVRDGVTPEAIEPITAAGSILGAIAIRWVTGARPPVPRVRDVLRTAAVAAAPALCALHAAERRQAADQPNCPDVLLGPGPAAERVRDAIRRAALAPYPVLIEGESGSGKELAARAIHARSARRNRKFCAVNCAALTDDLIEAELFGHARGAFTGALADRPGLFEEADQGTIFFDEAAELTARAQAKLLRVLQEGEIRRVGENLPRRIDARIVAATNRPLDGEVRSGRFRPDLRFRLDVIRIVIPPLRDRPDDIPWLVERIWSDAAGRVGTRATLGPDVIGTLARYDWPGNVRELQNVIATLAVHGPRRGRVPAALLPVHIAGSAMRFTGIDAARDEFERRFVRAALAQAGGRRTTAAAQLGVTRQGLAKIIKRLGIVES
jgi:DNA-binding NtrC family response regulator/tetratricopeptide (TPR) repeat protein